MAQAEAEQTQPQFWQERDGDSISSQDPHNNKTKKAKNRRPANNAFRQQRLKAWQPILTPKTVLPLFFAIGIIFAPIGGLLLWASAQVNEVIFDYSQCLALAPTDGEGKVPAGTVTWKFQKSYTNLNAGWNRSAIDGAQYTYPNGVTINTTVCSLFFEVPEDMGNPVLFYYRLTNFYQNHRRYVKSFDSNQLKGDAVANSTISSGDCDPLALDPHGRTYYPCGIVANSQFNDTQAIGLNANSFSNPVLLGDAESSTYYMSNNSGISWSSDAELYGKTKYSTDQIAVPPNWVKRFPGGYETTPPPDLSQDEAFQAWMRTAGLPTFSKLAQRNDSAIMKRGNYRVDVNYNFPVLEYGGTKSILLTTRTIMGGKNPFLGIAYVVVGGICIILGTIFTVTHLIRPRKLGDHTYLSWDNEGPSAATTSGRDSARSRAA